MTKDVEGIYVIDKPYGMSSQQAVQTVKYWARRKTGDKNIKVGHGGTLDPCATGVLVVAVGRTHTKNIDKIVATQKEYVADIFLGQTSTTDDAEGDKTDVDVHTVPKRNDIENCVASFVGRISQVPPAYSAIKISGQEAYKRVRRGENIVMQSRRVHIHDITIISYTYPMLTIRVTCGKGTYIRALARDIGATLGVGAYLRALTRTRVGAYTQENARSLDDFCLHIGVHASELDQERIDGTRVYLHNVLTHMQKNTAHDRFTLYHRRDFHPALRPPDNPRYRIARIPDAPLWTQTRFARALWKDAPDVVWMPLHNAPLIHKKHMKIVVTIHDVAFLRFPQTFPAKDLRKLRFLTRHAVRTADHIIAVSHATKKDLLTYYPRLSADDITVVHHGIDMAVWQKTYPDHVVRDVLATHCVAASQYIVHVGAVQPRKNLVRLIAAFERIKKTAPHMKLVLVGGRGWLWETIEQRAKDSVYADDILFAGNIPFRDVVILVQNAGVCVLPSLYEGFGLPVLEAMAARTPVVAARNSSITEIAGDAAVYCDANSSASIARGIVRVLSDAQLQHTLRTKGTQRAAQFSWEHCAKNTLRVLHRIA